jgi:hypothetical protein
VLASYAATLGQDVFRAASVFNFYPPGYRFFGGNGLLGPEFKLDDSSTALGRVNFVNTVVLGTIPASPPDRPVGTSLDFSALLPLAPYPSLLVDELDGLLLHRSMLPVMHDTIVTAVEAVSASNALSRVKTAAYLVASSSEYQVER